MRGMDIEKRMRHLTAQSLRTLGLPRASQRPGRKDSPRQRLLCLVTWGERILGTHRERHSSKAEGQSRALAGWGGPWRMEAYLAGWPPAASRAWPATWQGHSVRSGTPAVSRSPEKHCQCWPRPGPLLSTPPPAQGQCLLPHRGVEGLCLLLLAPPPAQLPTARV